MLVKRELILVKKKIQNEFIYERDIDWLKSCDVMVADGTVPSLGVGYEIAYAESINISILCLFNTTQIKPLSAMILGNQKLECSNYANLNEAIFAIDQFFSKESKMMLRLILIISIFSLSISESIGHRNIYKN